MQKLNTDLAEPEDDLILIDKLNFGKRLRQAGHFCKANELFFEVYKQDRNLSKAKELKFTLDCTITEIKNEGKFFSEDDIWKVFNQICW